MTEDRYRLTAEGTVTEDTMRRALDVAQPHMNALSAEVITVSSPLGRPSTAP